MCNNMHMDIEKANKLLTRIKNSGKYEIESDYTKADVVIVVTCAFGNGKVKSMQIISDVEVNMLCTAKLILTGCMVKTNSELLNKVVGAVVMELSEVMNIFSDNEIIETFIPQNKVIISNGCLKKCSYCVYPNIECKYVSKPKEHIFEEVEKLYENETTIYITGGLETSDYGIDLYKKEYDISSLIKDICTKFPNCNYIIGWFHPCGLTDEFISVIEQCKNVIEIMVHIQHVSDTVLKNMRRPNFSFTDERIRKIKNVRPDISISTEVIVGFPGETETDFIDLVKYLDKGYFDDIGVASYEQVCNTEAAKLPQIPMEVRIERMEFLLNRYRTTSSYPSPKVEDAELENLYLKFKKTMMEFKGVILNNEARQQYKYVAGTDTSFKLNIEKTIFQIYETVLNARDELEIKKVSNEVQNLYTKEFRVYIFRIICKIITKQAIISRAERILLG